MTKQNENQDDQEIVRELDSENTPDPERRSENRDRRSNQSDRRDSVRVESSADRRSENRRD